MAIIKSAWEIALEKTKDLKVDEKKYKRDAVIQRGRKLAASFLQDDKMEENEVRKRIGETKGEEKTLLLQGLVTACLDNISLPENKQYKLEFNRLRSLVDAIGNKFFSTLVGRLEQFFDQYLSQIDQLTQRAKMQYQPQLEQKQEQLRQQYGPDITLRPEQDPEFLKMLSQLLKQVDDQYGQTITSAKEQVRQTFGLSSEE